MLLRLFFCLLLLPTVGSVAAQKKAVSFIPYRPYAVKTDLAALAQSGAAVSWEWRLNPRAGVELTAAFEHYPTALANLFSGELAVRSTLRRTQSSQGNTDTWISETRPLPNAPAFVPRVTWQLQASRRSWLNWRRGRAVGIYLAPGLTLTAHRFYRIRQHTIIEKEIHPTPTTTETTYLQTRSMQPQLCWLGGFSYEGGVAWRIRRRLLLEAAATAGLNLPTPYRDPALPGWVQSGYLRLHLQVGLLLGREMKPIPWDRTLPIRY